jgi:hypothetical protein
VPSGDHADTYRIVLDESSFDFRDHADEEVQTALAELNDLLAQLDESRHAVARWSDVYEVECRDGLALHHVLFDMDRSSIDDVEKRRLMIALSRLPCWDDDEPVGVPLEPRVEGRAVATLAPSVGYALLAATHGFGVACAVLPLASPQEGHRMVSDSCGEQNVFFFASMARLPAFWRSTLTCERVSEQVFFERVEDAFPNLAFHEGLSFSRFDGGYPDLREPVVRILSMINDEFVRVWRDRIGQPHEVEGEMRSFGVVMTRESVKTRASAKHMAMRDVDHVGASYRCEWHAKLEPHRNRIHLALPCEALSGRVLIGIFVDHLPTP